MLLQNLNPSKSFYARPYDSTEGFSVEGKIILFLLIIGFGLYIVFRVWWSLRKEK